jgi:hypothetical protein
LPLVLVLLPVLVLRLALLRGGSGERDATRILVASASPSRRISHHPPPLRNVTF